jgi:putative DNA primase/helicase
MTTTEPDAPWSDRFDALTACWLQEHRIEVGDVIAGRAVATVALDAVFHPVLDYLSRCKWDGRARIDTWTTTYLGAPDNHYTRAIGARWLIAAIARVGQPGCKADCALILEGPQGIQKSTALRILAAPWFTDDIADLGTKDAALQLAGVWVIELAELDSISRGDVSRIKTFMSRTTDRFRPPYGHHVIEQPRQCVFAGTANHNEYLRDDTGGRRFWPLTCSVILVDQLAADRDQLWAEAMHRYRNGEKWWLDSRQITRDAEDEQAARYQSDAWMTIITEFCAGVETVSIDEILKGALFLPIDKWGQREQNRVASCLRAAGWERYQQRQGPQKRPWRYRRLSPPSPLSSHEW